MLHLSVLVTAETMLYTDKLCSLIQVTKEWREAFQELGKGEGHFENYVDLSMLFL